MKQDIPCLKMVILRKGILQCFQLPSHGSNTTYLPLSNTKIKINIKSRTHSNLLLETLTPCKVGLPFSHECPLIPHFINKLVPYLYFNLLCP